MNAIDIVILVLTIAAVIGVITFAIIRKKQGKSGCGCGCDCSSCSSCPSAGKNPSEKTEENEQQISSHDKHNI